MACDPAYFLEGIGSLDIDFQEFTFLDLGSGKGRALLLAARFPFRSIVGLEFVTDFHLIAMDNLNTLTPNMRRRILLINDDVIRYQIPLVPLVVFLFNPFDVHITKQVAQKLSDSYRYKPRPLIVFYLNPVFLTVFTKLGWREVESFSLSSILTLK